MVTSIETLIAISIVAALIASILLMFWLTVVVFDNRKF